MEQERKEELSGLLTTLPPVEFCCVYGSTLHPTGSDKSRMIDYILGVQDPVEWHKENLKLNRNHYARWMSYLGGPKLVTEVADKIGVGVHFNPFVSWNNKTYKYGVVRMHDLTQDILHWEKFYLCGRLQKPVNVLVDSLDIKHINSYNLAAATSAALLLLPSNFTEEDLYAKICSLSYMGDVRMLFAEDRNKVKRIVHGQFELFKKMYRPTLEKLSTKDLISFSSTGSSLASIYQDCCPTAAHCLISRLPTTVRDQMCKRLGETEKMSSGRVAYEVVVGSKEEAADCMRKILSRKVMASSMKQAAAGLLTVGVVGASRYVANKMQKAWTSWT